MNKKNYYLIAFTVLFLAFFALSVGNEKEIEESEVNLNENLEIELPREITEPDEITLEKPKPSWAGSMNNITIDETGWTPGSLTWAEAALKPWCTQLPSGRYIIENVTIDASGSPPEGSGIFINYSLNTYFTIKNCTITGASYAGIYLQSTHNGTLIDNNCSNNNLGISIRGSVTPFLRSANNTIANNTLSWNNQGFQCWSADDNIIDNNILNNNDAYGIGVSGRTNNNNFTNNIIRDDSSVNPRVTIGINFFNNNNSNVINNTIINCQDGGMRLSWTSDNNTIENNTIINSLGYGILLNGDVACQNNEVKNNTIINARQAGIRLNRIINSTTITDNTMKNCSILIDPTTYVNSLTYLRSITIASNNTVNGDPVYYYIDEVGLDHSNFTNLGDIGQIILINCNDSDISDFTIPNPIPITLWYCNNITISNNILDLNGYGHSGILLCNSIDFIIQNCTISDPAGGSYPTFVAGCIKLTNSSKGKIYSNDLTSTPGGYESGICLYETNNIIIINNTCEGITYGIFLRNSNQNLIFNNTVDSNDHVGIFLQENCHYNNITQNSASSTAVYYGIALYSNSNNNNIINNTANNNDDYGIFIQIGCTDNKIINNTVCNTGGGTTQNIGIYVYSDCTNNDIIDNTANNNYDHGIKLHSSHDNTLIENTACENRLHGIDLDACYNNTIDNNIANDNGFRGIYMLNCFDNNITNNYLGNVATTDQDEGIYLQGGSYNDVINNTANGNLNYGIYLYVSNNNNIINNTANNNDDVSNSIDYGIYLSNSHDNTLIDNTVCENGYLGIDLVSSHNNTIDDNIANDNWLYGIYLLNCIDNNITNNYVANVATSYQDRGIYLQGGSNNNVINNTANGNNDYGISLYDSDNNNIINNTANNNDDFGIYLSSSHDNILIENTACENGLDGIELATCYNNTVADNIANDNGASGIKLINCIDNNITNNYVSNVATTDQLRGIYLFGGSNNNVINNTANGNSDYGIYLYISDNNNIINNTANNNDDFGIYLYASHDNILIENTACENGMYGIELNACYNNTVENNIANDNGYIGGSYRYGIFLYNCIDNNITNNYVSNVATTDQLRGIYLQGGSNNNVINNTANGNLDYGIVLYLSNNNDLINNTCNDNKGGTDNKDMGIFLHGSNYNNIINNTVNNNGNDGDESGIYLYSSSHNNTIHSNIIKNNFDNGIYLHYGCDENKIYGNIINNNPYGITITAIGGTSDDNIIIGNKLSGNTASIEDDGTNTREGMNNVDGVCTSLTIDEDGGTASSFTWAEVIFYVSWISGSGTSGNPYLIKDITVDAENSNYGLSIFDSKNEYFTIENCFITGAYHSAIYLYETCNGTIINNNCSNNNFAGTGGGGHGIGLWSYSHNNKIVNNTFNWNYRGIHTGYSYNLIIANNTLKYNNLQGIMLSSRSYYCNVTGNMISSDPASPQMDEGILLYNSHGNNFINNSIEDCSNNGIRLSYTSSDNTFENNIINNSLGRGIYIYDRSDGNRFLNNKITNCDVDGIHLSTDCDENNFTGNFISNNGDHGVYIVHATCENNLLYNNSFIGNPDNALDVGSNTKWNNTQIGNYWDDYDGVDANDDNIGDTAYNVSSGKYDEMPIWWDAPVVTIISPVYLDTYGNATINFTLSITKTTPSLCEMSYMLVNKTNPVDRTGNQTFNQYPTHFILYNLWNSLENGTIKILFFVNDSKGYIGSAYVIILKNIYIPTISLVKIGFYGVGGFTTINFTVALDGPGVNEFWYRIYNGTWSNNYTFNAIVGQMNREINPGLWKSLDNGTWTIEFFLDDDKAAKANNQTSISTTFIKDIVAPSVIITNPSNNDVEGESTPDISFSIYEGQLHQIWYQLDDDGTIYGNYTYRDDITSELYEILYTYWKKVTNGTVIIKFWANDTGGNVNYTILTLTLQKDLEVPIITDITRLYEGFVYGSTPPFYTLDITEPHFYQYWYTLFDGTNLYNSAPKTSGINFLIFMPLSSGSSPRTAGTEVSGSIDQSLWNQLNNGQINITFYIEDEGGNVGYKDVMVIREVQAAAAALLPGDDDDDGVAEESVDWVIRALLAGVISGSVGISLRIAYSKIKKKREAAREAAAPTVILKKKYQIVHHDLLTKYGKVEQKEFRVGIAQVGLSQKGNILTELYEMTPEGLMRIREDMVETVTANIKSMIEQAHENKINILLFPEMTFDLNYKAMVKDVKKWAQDYNMYIITGGYHDIKTKQNICAVFGPEKIQWEQEKHTPATIHFGKHVFTEAIEIHHPPHKLHICSTEFGRIAIAICRDFLDMDLRVEVKNCEPPVDLFFNPAYTPVTVDFEATHFDARRSVYAYTFFANVAEYGGTIINTPEKDRTKRMIPPKEEGLIFKDVDLFSLRSERRKWERRQSKGKRYIQSTRS